jgi:hypothetical protein
MGKEAVTTNWCPATNRTIRQARAKNLLFLSLLYIMIGMPFITLSMIYAGASMDTLLGASIICQWIGILILVSRTRGRLRPPGNTHVGPSIFVDNLKLLRFREHRPKTDETDKPMV